MAHFDYKDAFFNVIAIHLALIMLEAVLRSEFMIFGLSCHQYYSKYWYHRHTIAFYNRVIIHLWLASMNISSASFIWKRRNNSKITKMFLFLLYYQSFLLRICAAICEGNPIIFRKKGRFGCFSTMVKKNFRSEKLFLFFYPLYCLHISVNRFSWKPNKRWCSVKPYSLILIIGQWEIFILFALFNINVGVVPSLLMNK